MIAPTGAHRRLQKEAESNDGGRVLEGTPSTIEVLPEIVDAVGSKTTVLIDSSFRRGTDVLKALSLGAKGVFLGRPPLWGLGAFGSEGVQRVMELITRELMSAMAWPVADNAHYRALTNRPASATTGFGSAAAKYLATAVEIGCPVLSS